LRRWFALLGGTSRGSDDRRIQHSTPPSQVLLVTYQIGQSIVPGSKTRRHLAHRLGNAHRPRKLDRLEGFGGNGLALVAVLVRQRPEDLEPPHEYVAGLAQFALAAAGEEAR